MFSSRWRLLLSRTRMKIPGSHNKLIWLACVTVSLAVPGVAQPPDKPPGKRTPSEKPQVIYHVRPTSDYAATLHSQAKGQNNDVPAEGGKSPSVEPPRPNPVVPAPETRRPLESVQQGPEIEQRHVKQPKAQSNHVVRPHAFKPQKQHGNPHGGKSHKK
jgi:hypothetical protein